jgi:hypothetical protein
VSLLDEMAETCAVTREAVPFKDPARWREELQAVGLDPDATYYGVAPPPGHRWETDAEFRERISRIS